MPLSDYRYYTRRWLNRPGFHAGAYVIGSVDCSRCDGAKTGSLTIADCSRLIRLDFDSISRDSRSNSLHKADVLLKTLSEIRAEFADSSPQPRQRK